MRRLPVLLEVEAEARSPWVVLQGIDVPRRLAIIGMHDGAFVECETDIGERFGFRVDGDYPLPALSSLRATYTPNGKKTRVCIDIIEEEA